MRTVERSMKGAEEILALTAKLETMSKKNKARKAEEVYKKYE